MSKVKIQGAEYPIHKIFSDDFLFQIPPYQRPYSWTTEQAAALFDDIKAACEKASGSEPDPYFLGSIVLAKEDGSAEAKVIDGQQRLTTLTILIAALAARLTPKDGAQLRKLLFQEGFSFIGAADVYRLTPRPRDVKFFRTYVQEPDGLTRISLLELAQLTDAQRNMADNAVLFVEKLGELTDEGVVKLTTYLLNFCYLVAVSTPNSDTAFRIFTVLNDRGLDLTAADIIKNELIGHLPSTQQDLYTGKWEDLEEELGAGRFGELFSHIRMIFARAKSRGNLLGEFRANVKVAFEDPARFIDEWIEPLGDVYTRVTRAAWESSTHAEPINENLKWLNRIDNSDWVPPALDYLRRHRHEPKLLAAFLIALERMAASMFIRRTGINARIERHGRLLEEIASGSDVMAPGGVLDLTKEEREETLQNLSGELYLLGRPLSYVLLRLDAALGDGTATFQHAVITVEHVLPQTPSSESKWVSLFTTEQRAYWTHRLGNLVLLHRRKNSAAQNFDFSIKKEKYFGGGDGAAPFLLTNQVLLEPTWEPAVVEKRQSQLLAKLTQIWRLEPDG